MRALVPFLVALALAACGEAPSAAPPSPPNFGIHSITVSSSSYTVALNDSLLVHATTSGAETSFNWTSSNQAVATVSAQGWVRGLSVGDVDIVACSQIQTGLCGATAYKVR